MRDPVRDALSGRLAQRISDLEERLAAVEACLKETRTLLSELANHPIHSMHIPDSPGGTA